MISDVLPKSLCVSKVAWWPNPKWAATWQNQQNECAPTEYSDQPGHPPSLIRVFAVRMKIAWVISYLLSAQRRLWSDWGDAQADLSLRWAHSHFVSFVMSRLKFSWMGGRFVNDCRLSFSDSPLSKKQHQAFCRFTITSVRSLQGSKVMGCENRYNLLEFALIFKRPKLEMMPNYRIIYLCLVIFIIWNLFVSQYLPTGCSFSSCLLTSTLYLFLKIPGQHYVLLVFVNNDSCHLQMLYSQSFVYCRVFVLIIIDYSTKKSVLVYSRKCASEIVYFRSNPYVKQCELMC